MASHHFVGSFVGSSRTGTNRNQHSRAGDGAMALNDTFIKNAKHSGKPAGDKHSDGGGLYRTIH